jgi:hypothetical protein
MSTSGSTDFSLTTNQIVQDILELCQVAGIGDSVPGEDYSSVVRTLNLMIKAWQTEGIQLHTETEAILFLEDGKSKYQLGGSGADRASNEIIKTEISADEASGQTTLSVDDSSDMAASDIIGIELDDNTIHWTTISSIPNSTSVIVNSAITDDASSGNNVYAYTTAMGRPINISQARLLKDDGTIIVLQPRSRKEYFSRPNRNATGNPTEYFVDYQRDKTFISFYPVPDNVSSRIELSYRRIVEDFDSSADEPDFQQFAIAAITYNGAVWVGRKYGKDISQTDIGVIATQSLQSLKGYDQERTSLKIRPRIDW